MTKCVAALCVMVSYATLSAPLGAQTPRAAQEKRLPGSGRGRARSALELARV